MKTILKNCRLIPELSGGVKYERADVVIDGGRIVSVREADGCGKDPAVSAQEDGAKKKGSQEAGCMGLHAGEGRCEAVDCTGMTLLPGFIDCHTHLNYDYYNGVLRLDDCTLLLNSMKSARLYPKYGVTTIRDMGAPRRVAQQVKKAIAMGVAEGPRIVTGGMILNPLNRTAPPDPYCFVRCFSGIDEVTSAVREEIGGGADFVKLYATGNPPDLLPEELSQAVRLAHRAHRKVAVHAHDEDAITMCIDEGVDTIEHATKIRHEDVDRIAGREDIHLVPTLAIFSPTVPLSGTPQAEKDKRLTPLLEAGIPCLKYAYEKGLIMGIGTDVQIEHFGEQYGLEFRMRYERLGMSVVDILLQATVYGARILGLSEETGSIREGLSADLVLVKGDPREDVSVLYRRPEAVWVRGRLWKSDEFLQD